MGAPNLSKHPYQSPQHFQNLSVSNSAVDIFSGAGNLYGFFVENNASAAIYIQIFDKPASQVVLGIDTPVMSFKVPGDQSFGRDAMPHALRHFENACSVAVTAGRTDATAPAAGATVHAWYWNS